MASSSTNRKLKYLRRIQMSLKKSRSVWLALLLLSLALGLSNRQGSAQTSTQGAIAGTSVDASGGSVPAAKVTIHNEATGFTLDLISDSSGFFKAPLLEPGTYT